MKLTVFTEILVKTLFWSSLFYFVLLNGVLIIKYV